MIIVSQDKKVITNFDNTVGLQINDHIFNSDGERDFVIKVFTETRDCTIGIYETEARAKEVLQEIITAYTTEAVVEYNGYISFEMPKE